ncbi:MAG: glycosyltransferase family 9 protein [Candidatus Eisenbacteria bacterium]|nr:glycosyltransferase family 9 protein [Candidatus Eisenbacteria bacterium]
MNVERILLTRLRYIGDVVLTTSCIRALRESFPKAEIVYLTQAPYGELLMEHPLLARTITIDRASYGAREALSLMWNLMRTRYSLAIDLFANPRSAILTASTLAARRVGTYHLSRSWAYNVNVRVAPEIRSAVEHHLEHLRKIGLNVRFSLPELFVTKDESREGERIMRALGAREPRRTVLIQPGAKWQAKRWPSERFVEVARLVRGEALDVGFLAGPGEESLVEDCARSVPGARVVAGLTLRELMKVMSVTAGYVGNDGGPTHVSAALGRVTVGVFGPSEPDVWFPYGVGGRAACVYEQADCRPCHLHFCEHVSCLKRIDARRVFSRLMDLVSTRNTEA